MDFGERECLAIEGNAKLELVMASISRNLDGRRHHNFKGARNGLIVALKLRRNAGWRDVKRPGSCDGVRMQWIAK
jgi:hypothetical protein